MMRWCNTKRSARRKLVRRMKKCRKLSVDPGSTTPMVPTIMMMSLIWMALILVVRVQVVEVGGEVGVEAEEVVEVQQERQVLEVG